jgi:hypothetical protein
MVPARQCDPRLGTTFSSELVWAASLGQVLHFRIEFTVGRNVVVAVTDIPSFRSSGVFCFIISMICLILNLLLRTSARSL